MNATIMAQLALYPAIFGAGYLACWIYQKWRIYENEKWYETYKRGQSGKAGGV